MTEKSESRKTQRWLYGIIALLLFALVVETGILIQKKKSKSKETRPLITHETQGVPDSLSGRQPFRRARLQEQDPFAADPFSELERMRAHMNRLVNTALTYGPPLAQSLSGGELYNFMPAVDLEETDKAYILRGDLPGLEKDKINITVRGNILTIQGIRETKSEKKDEEGGFYAQERSYGSFARTVTLPGPVDETNVKAEYKDGVLSITLPKAGDTKTTQKIAIQ